MHHSPFPIRHFGAYFTPLIHRLDDKINKRVWFDDDATAGGNLAWLKIWWDRISEIGPDFGDYLNATKTWVVVRDSSLEEAKQLFRGTGASITVEGKGILEQQPEQTFSLTIMSNTRSLDGSLTWNTSLL